MHHAAGTGKHLPAELIISKARVKAAGKKCNVGGEFYGALDAAASSAFYKELAAEIGKVDAFVAKRRDELRAGLDGSTPVTKLSKELDELRSYVGTNLVAATKIVKKHDKNVAPELSKRERVAALVNSCAGLNGVPELQRKIDQQNSLKTNDKKSGAALEQVRLAARDIDATNDVGDENDTETTLRSLPYWLLAGAQADAALDVLVERSLFLVFMGPAFFTPEGAPRSCTWPKRSNFVSEVK